MLRTPSGGKRILSWLALTSAAVNVELLSPSDTLPCSRYVGTGQVRTGRRTRFGDRTLRRVFARRGGPYQGSGAPVNQARADRESAVTRASRRRGSDGGVTAVLHLCGHLDSRFDAPELLDEV